MSSSRFKPNDDTICLSKNAARLLNTPVKSDGSRFGDFKSDCDIDLRDYRSYVTCALDSGPGTPGTPVECPDSFDYDGDGDIDLKDLSRLQVT